MKHGYHHLACAAGLTFALTVVFLAGCGERMAQPGDLVIDLGNKTTIRFARIESMHLFVGKYEVSNKIYRRFKPNHTSGQHKGLDLNQDDQPVVNVSWNDAQQFCEWLTKTNGTVGTRHYRFRLPTEKEWTTFAACGQEIEYPWGTTWPPPKNWNYYGIENPEPTQHLDNNDSFRVSCPVQKSGVNAWHLFGVGGNAWEWCADADGQSKSRVFKGASWLDCNQYFLTLSRRSSNAPDYRSVNLGFRIVAEASEGSGEERPRPEAGQKPKAAAAKAKPEKATAP